VTTFVPVLALLIWLLVSVSVPTLAVMLPALPVPLVLAEIVLLLRLMATASIVMAPPCPNPAVFVVTELSVIVTEFAGDVSP
jgi:hypothetical protein